MGCDIHALIQTKNFLGHWEVAIDLNYLGRCYDTFGLLAGVRGSDTGYRPKGLPKDVEDGYDLGDHSHSYNDLKELKQLYRLRKTIGLPEMFQNIVKLMKAIKRIYYLDDESVRIVYGFDS